MKPTLMQHAIYRTPLVDDMVLMTKTSAAQDALASLLMRDDIKLAEFEHHSIVLALQMLSNELSKRTLFIKDELCASELRGDDAYLLAGAWLCLQHQLYKQKKTIEQRNNHYRREAKGGE